MPNMNSEENGQSLSSQEITHTFMTGSEKFHELLNEEGAEQVFYMEDDFNNIQIISSKEGFYVNCNEVLRGPFRTQTGCIECISQFFLDECAKSTGNYEKVKEILDNWD